MTSRMRYRLHLRVGWRQFQLTMLIEIGWLFQKRGLRASEFNATPPRTEAVLLHCCRLASPTSSRKQHRPTNVRRRAKGVTHNPDAVAPLDARCFPHQRIARSSVDVRPTATLDAKSTSLISSPRIILGARISVAETNLRIARDMIRRNFAARKRVPLFNGEPSYGRRHDSSSSNYTITEAPFKVAFGSKSARCDAMSHLRPASELEPQRAKNKASIMHPLTLGFCWSKIRETDRCRWMQCHVLLLACIINLLVNQLSVGFGLPVCGATRSTLPAKSL